jgi:hypothetical protein
MSDFDPIKAQREELVGWNDWRKRLKVIAMHKEELIDEATTERDALLGTASLLDGMIEKGQARLRALEDERDAKAKGEPSPQEAPP